MSKEKVQQGLLPQWGKKELPAPPKFNFRNVTAVIGPGTIALSLSLGGGEWVLGPSAVVKYGVGLLWITLVAVILQVLLNMEFIRYTMYTGEPIFTGFMRTKPGPKFWGWFYPILGVLQVGWPAWALASASVLFAGIHKRLPVKEIPADTNMVVILGYVTFFLAITIVMVGGKIERTLEVFSWFVVSLIATFLIVVNIWLVPAKTWLSTFTGFFRFATIPKGADWILLGAFAAYSGAGGLGNCWLTNWIRDKGFGMSKTIGFIPTAIAGKKINIPQVGNIFTTNYENMSKWRKWWKYVLVDQGLVFGLGCLLGMYLPVLLAVGIIPPGTELKGLAIGSYQAAYLAKIGGQALWFLTLFVGFCILFGTQISIIDGFTRTVADIIWTASKKARNLKGGDIRYVYYSILIIFTVCGCIAIIFGNPYILLVIGANIGGAIFAISGIHVLIVNRRFLPKEVRPSLWREIAVILCVIFYSFFVIMVIGTYLKLW
ncbi:MAG: Nramp family divalent metal transporter [Candidatus Aminicenantia bacterium]